MVIFFLGTSAMENSLVFLIIKDKQQKLIVVVLIFKWFH